MFTTRTEEFEDFNFAKFVFIFDTMSEATWAFVNAAFRTLKCTNVWKAGGRGEWQVVLTSGLIH